MHMKLVTRVEEAVNSTNLPPGSRIYSAGNATTPQILLQQLSRDESIRDVELLGVLLLGEIDLLFSRECCNRVTHRVIFNSKHSRFAVNNELAMYLV